MRRNRESIQIPVTLGMYINILSAELLQMRIYVLLFLVKIYFAYSIPQFAKNASRISSSLASVFHFLCLSVFCR